MAAVSLQNVEKLYANGVYGIRGMNLDVADGELVVLAGPSGSGKTTTLRVIAGLEQPTGGVIHIAGRPANRLPARMRDVAMVFQQHNLYPNLTVKDNLASGMRWRDQRNWFHGFLLGLLATAGAWRDPE